MDGSSAEEPFFTFATLNEKIKWQNTENGLAEAWAGFWAAR